MVIDHGAKGLLTILTIKF